MKWLNVVAKLRELLSLVAALAEWFARRPDVEPPEQLKSLLPLAAECRDALASAEKQSSNDDFNDGFENYRG